MPDGELDPKRRLPAAQVTRGRLAARVVSSGKVAASAVSRGMLAARAVTRGPAKEAPMSDTVTCTCGTAVDAVTRAPVGPLSARGAGCAHAVKGTVRPTESKIGRAVETK